VPKETKYKIGDIVRLKSGGPSLTVHAIHPDGNIACHWFAGNKLEYGVFTPDSIGLEDELDPLKKLGKAGR
jgi:uncharacterized protein YodC (DUF2158 family)